MHGINVLLRLTMKVKPYDEGSTSQAGLSSGTHLCLIRDITMLCPSLIK